VLDLFENRRTASTVAGISDDMLGAYTRGESKPSFQVLARIARAKGVSLDWLASGEGEMMLSQRSSLSERLSEMAGRHRDQSAPRPHAKPQVDNASANIDAEYLRAIIEAVELYLERTDRTLNPAAKAEMIAFIYEKIPRPNPGREPIDSDAVAKLLKLVG
jgi:transcriptional regulator with XRE-family HTH domain